MNAPALLDRLGRPLRDLRVSVTDRCNLRCGYCMPREVFGLAFRFLPRAEILTYEEIARVVRIFREHGVEKVRLTGGEPLLRRDLPLLVEMLAATQGLEIALTTNGVLLAEMAPGLAAAGLTRVSVSLDSLDDAVFRAMADADVPVERVLQGIDAALAAGLAPVKINAVVRRGMNDHTVVDLARRFKGTGATVRFIEYMDVGATNGWRMDEVVPAAEIVTAIDAAMPIVPIGRQRPGEVAERWAYADGSGEVGVIASVTRPFCGDCTRARLSAEGRVYTCLFAAAGTDLRGPLREGASDEEIAAILRRLWTSREDRYSELRTEAGASGPTAPRIEMSYIGG